jgi:hypothetical protein
MTSKYKWWHESHSHFARKRSFKSKIYWATDRKLVISHWCWEDMIKEELKIPLMGFAILSHIESSPVSPHVRAGRAGLETFMSQLPALCSLISFNLLQANNHFRSWTYNLCPRTGWYSYKLLLIVQMLPIHLPLQSFPEHFLLVNYKYLL